jgi:hypothetical protein
MPISRVASSWNSHSCTSPYFCLIDAGKFTRLLMASDSPGEAAEHGKGSAESLNAPKSAHPIPPQLEDD